MVYSAGSSSEPSGRVLSKGQRSREQKRLRQQRERKERDAREQQRREDFAELQRQRRVAAAAQAARGESPKSAWEGPPSDGIVRSFRESVVAANARDAAFRQSASLVPIALAPSAPPPGSGWAGTPPDGVARTFRESVEMVNAARQRSPEPAPITPVSRSVTPVFGSGPTA